jgi:uncharacterized tellurite resistance protein B-like protein
MADGVVRRGRGAIVPVMLQDLIRRLAGPPARDPLTPEDARLAMAALMVRVSRTDGHYADAERHLIDAVLADRYGLSPREAARVRAEAETAEEGAQDTVQFTRLIKEAVPYEEREGVVEALWRVAAGDEGISADEHGLMRLVANLLGVADQDSALARHRATRGR